VPRKIFDLKTDEVWGGWRGLHMEELHNLYCSLSIMRMMMRWAGHVVRVEKRNAFRIFWKVHKESEPVERPRHRRKDSIKLDLRDLGWDGMDWIYLAQDMDQCSALENPIMNLRVPYYIFITARWQCSAGKLLSGRAARGFSRRARLHGVSSLVVLSHHVIQDEESSVAIVGAPREMRTSRIQAWSGTRPSRCCDI
jgi:hypothetical protein